MEYPTTTKTGIAYSLDTNRFAKSFVWVVWAMMVLLAIACAYRYGRNLPLEEDWQMVPPLTGHDTNYGRFLWEQNNEHRIPLPKLVYLLLLKATHGDFRSGMYFNVLALAGLTALLIQTANRLRGGQTHYTDAFFPLVLLHLGHWGNLYWGWQIGFVLPTALTLLQLIIIVQYRQLLSLRAAMLMSITTALLPLCGANGLLYLLPVSPWLLYEGFLHFRKDQPAAKRKVGILLFTGMLTAFLISIAYFIGYVKPYWNPPNPGLLPTIKTAIEFLAMGLGPIASTQWKLFCPIILLFLAATCWLLISAVPKSKGAEFRRAIGLFFFFGGYMLFAAAMGYGRAAWVPTMGLPIRYVLPAVPPVILCYYTSVLYGTVFVKQGIQWSLCLLLLLFVYGNTRAAFTWKNWYKSSSDAVLRDINHGVPQSELFRRHQPFLLHWNPQYLNERMLQLKRAGMGPFKNMVEDSVQATK